MKRIDDYAFCSCKGLRKGSFDSLTQLGEDVFQDALDLDTLEMPSLRVVGSDFINDCEFIKRLSIPRDLKPIIFNQLDASIEGARLFVHDERTTMKTYFDDYKKSKQTLAWEPTLNSNVGFFVFSINRHNLNVTSVNNLNTFVPFELVKLIVSFMSVSECDKFCGVSFRSSDPVTRNNKRVRMTRV